MQITIGVAPTPVTRVVFFELSDNPGVWCVFDIIEIDATPERAIQKIRAWLGHNRYAGRRHQIESGVDFHDGKGAFYPYAESQRKIPPSQLPLFPR